MSIIYDALKKVEQSQTPPEPTPNTAKTAKPGIKVYLTYISVVLMGVIVASIFWGVLIKPPFTTSAKVASRLTPRSKAAPLQKVAQGKKVPPSPVAEEVKPPEVSLPESAASVQAPPAVAKSEPRMTFTLNGIFFSGNEGYALIDNQIVKEGDTIRNARVTRIGLDEVELESEGKVINLSVNSK